MTELAPSYLRYRRESEYEMTDQTKSAPASVEADDEEFCPKCFAGMDAANHYECIDLRSPEPTPDKA